LFWDILLAKPDLRGRMARVLDLEAADEELANLQALSGFFEKDIGDCMYLHSNSHLAVANRFLEWITEGKCAVN
jgi:hypothetical protein